MQTIWTVRRFCCLVGMIAPFAFVGADTAYAQGEMVPINDAGCVVPGYQDPSRDRPRVFVRTQQQTYDITFTEPRPAWNKRIKLTGRYWTGDALTQEGARTVSGDTQWDYDFDEQSCPDAPLPSWTTNGPPHLRGTSPVAGLERWAGTYRTHTRYGGATGTWVNERDLVITADGKITLSGKEIKGPMYSNGKFGWLAQDGNESYSRASLVPSLEKTEPYFFNPPVDGPAFQGGWLQANSPDGWLDFRGQRVRR